MAKYDIGELVAALNEAVNKLDNLRTKYKDSEKKNACLREALGELIYEVTHLSPQEDDGSHWCRITGRTLKKARAARGEKE